MHVFNKDFVVHHFANVVLQFFQLYNADSCFKAAAVAINLSLVYLHSTCHNPFCLSLQGPAAERSLGEEDVCAKGKLLCQAVGQLSCRLSFFLKIFLNLIVIAFLS